MLQTLCEISTDYPALLRQLKDPLKLRASEQVIQFPFALPVVEEKTEEELARITEKRREQGRKLQEMAAKTRMEKVCTFTYHYRSASLPNSSRSSCKRRTTCNTCLL